MAPFPSQYFSRDPAAGFEGLPASTGREELWFWAHGASGWSKAKPLHDRTGFVLTLLHSAPRNLTQV